MPQDQPKLTPQQIAALEAIMQSRKMQQLQQPSMQSLQPPGPPPGMPAPTTPPAPMQGQIPPPGPMPGRPIPPMPGSGAPNVPPGLGRPQFGGPPTSQAVAGNIQAPTGMTPPPPRQPFSQGGPTGRPQLPPELNPNAIPPDAQVVESRMENPYKLGGRGGGKIDPKQLKFLLGMMRGRG